MLFIENDRLAELAERLWYMVSSRLYHTFFSSHIEIFQPPKVAKIQQKIPKFKERINQPGLKTMTQTSEIPNDRLDRLEAALGRFAELTIQNTVRHDEALINQNDAIAATNANVNAQSATIDVLVSNIQQLTENVAAVNQRVDALTTNVTEVTNRVDSLAEQAAQDRQQAAIDRQRFDTRINQILEYLRDRNGGSSPPQ